MPLTADLPPPILDDDDLPIGRILSRREVLALFGAAGVAGTLAACAPAGVASSLVGASSSAPSSGAASSAATASGAASSAAVPSATAAGGDPSCVVVPALTEGPYYVNEGLERSDIRVDKATGQPVGGATLELSWVVSQVDGSACSPLQGVIVDVWHCDATGTYSDVQDPGFDTKGHDFLRGYQHTDATGTAAFTTIYPGWYSGRAVHIHFKIRTDPGASAGFEFTSQLFFDDALSSQVFASGPYTVKSATPDTPNARDGIYAQSGGATKLTVTRDGDAYRATFELALSLA